MKELNPTQKKVYEFLAERSQNGVPPSVREICAAVGLKSTSSVQANLIALEKAGYIERGDPKLKRSIRVLGPEADNTTKVPVVGTVTAGMPILAVEQIEEITGKKFSEINIVGGGCQNVLLNELTAKYTKRTVVAGPVEATATGNLLAQMLALKEIATLAEGKDIIKKSFEIKEINA